MRPVRGRVQATAHSINRAFDQRLGDRGPKACRRPLMRRSAKRRGPARRLALCLFRAPDEARRAADRTMPLGVAEEDRPRATPPRHEEHENQQLSGRYSTALLCPNSHVANVPAAAPPILPAKLYLLCSGWYRHPVRAKVLILEELGVLGLALRWLPGFSTIEAYLQAKPNAGETQVCAFRCRSRQVYRR